MNGIIFAIFAIVDLIVIAEIGRLIHIGISALRRRSQRNQMKLKQQLQEQIRKELNEGINNA